VRPEPTHSLRKLCIARHVHPPFAGCNYLVSVETEAAHISYRTGGSPFVLSAMRFRRVLNDSDPQLLLEFEQWVHVRRMSIDMNRHDGLGFVSHFLPNGRDVHIPRLRISVNQDSFCAGVLDRVY